MAQNENVNQQLLAALKWIVQRTEEGRYPDGRCLEDARSAIAAAEAAPPVVVAKENAKTQIENTLWLAIDLLAAFPSEKPDSRIWQHIKAYMPKSGVFQEGWRTYHPNVSSEHIEAIAKACKLIPSHTTKELIDRVVGFGHVLLGDKAVQEEFVEANAHLLRTVQYPTIAKPEQIFAAKS